MGFWNKSKSENRTNRSSEVSWINLRDEAQLDEIVENSFHRPQLIFKHSTRCGISRMVKDQFSGGYSLTEEEGSLYYLDLLKFRSLSQAITDRFDVWHESPQLIIIRDGAVARHASHGAILDIDLSKV